MGSWRVGEEENRREGMADKLNSQPECGVGMWSWNTSQQAWPLMDRNLRNSEPGKGHRNMVRLRAQGKGVQNLSYRGLSRRIIRRQDRA